MRRKTIAIALILTATALARADKYVEWEKYYRAPRNAVRSQISFAPERLRDNSPGFNGTQFAFDPEDPAAFFKPEATVVTNANSSPSNPGLVLNAAPILFADVTWDTRLVSTRTHYPSIADLTAPVASAVGALEKKKTDAETGSLPVIGRDLRGRYPRLKIGAQPGEFRIAHRRAITAGVGFNGQSATALLGSLTPYVGLVPIAGSAVLSEQLAKSMEAADTMQALEFPKAASEIEQWRTGDRVMATSTGGVMFVAGAGAYGLSVGTKAVAIGDWSTDVRKIGDGRIFVQLMNRKLLNVAITEGAGIASLSQDRIAMSSTGFSYMMNLENPKAAAAFEKLVAGYAIDAQNMANDPSDVSVIAVDQSISHATGNINSLSLGIPFLYWHWSRGKIQNSSSVDFLPNRSRTETEHGIYMDTSDTRFITSRGNRTMGFYAVSYRTQGEDGKTDEGEFAQLGWSYQRTRASHYALRSAIHALVRRTGMKEELMVEVPEVEENLDYINIDFGMKIDQNATALLVDLASSEERLEVLRKISQRFMDTYFTPEILAQEDRYNDICADIGWDPVRCVDEISRDTRHSIRQMESALRKMRETKGADRKAYVQAYAKFGKAMLMNQFTFQTILSLLKGRGITAKYTINGTQIAMYDLTFGWNLRPAISEPRH